MKGQARDKPVTDLPGICEVLGKRLRRKGYDKAYIVLRQYLVFKKNEELIRDWLNQVCGANARPQQA